MTQTSATRTFLLDDSTQKVRDFAAKQNSESYLAVTVPAEDAEAGMDEMSRAYEETGRELYIGQGNRELD